MILKKFDVIDGNEIIQYSRLKEFRCVKTYTFEDGSKQTICSEWMPEERFARRRATNIARCSCIHPCFDKNAPEEMQTRTRNVEVRRIKRSNIIYCYGHFAPAELKPAYGGWDLH